MEPNGVIAVVLVVLFGIIFVLACMCYRFAFGDVARLESQRLHHTRGPTTDTRSDALPTEHGGGSASGPGAASDTVTA